MYNIILYYNFQHIDNVPKFCGEHRRKCRSLNLLGRVYIAEEGINGTLSGTTENIEEYKKFLCSLPGFERTEFKEDISETIPFLKLIVRIRPEIVTLKADIPLDPNTEGGHHLSPEEWRKVIESGEDYVMIDTRNDYEWKVGHFEGALLPPLKNFYDFPQWLDEAKIDKNKKVLMYCTGGIRCEKFSVLMKKKGYKDVNQLHGGIINYAKEQDGAHYKGKCFVFDDRLTVPIEKDQKEPLTYCEITGEPCDQYLNCANPDCNKLFICSEEGARQMEGCCSDACKSSKRRRPFDPDNIYEPSRKWYHYFETK
ncbi:MAG: rhodanese-related sulfurtransferase [Candidatus Omnitrophica bacterium]|nr:rhodanese-related sulfurtransferase [Candidatus Omnitrophota bacterium]